MGIVRERQGSRMTPTLKTCKNNNVIYHGEEQWQRAGMLETGAGAVLV